MADNGGAKISYFIAGLGMGALLGILFAPKSAEEMREYLLDRADESRDYAQRKTQELRERADGLLERSREIMDRRNESLTGADTHGEGNPPHDSDEETL